MRERGQAPWCAACFRSGCRSLTPARRGLWREGSTRIGCTSCIVKSLRSRTSPFRALSGRLKFTVRCHKFSKDLSLEGGIDVCTGEKYSLDVCWSETLVERGVHSGLQSSRTGVPGLNPRPSDATCQPFWKLPTVMTSAGSYQP
jgi:hypothetical protein